MGFGISGVSCSSKGKLGYEKEGEEREMKKYLNSSIAIFIFAFQGTGFGQTDPISSLVQIPGGTFIMGDVNDTFSNPHHGNDQIPLHQVELDGFRMGKTEIKSIPRVLHASIFFGCSNITFL